MFYNELNEYDVCIPAPHRGVTSVHYRRLDERHRDASLMAEIEDERAFEKRFGDPDVTDEIIEDAVDTEEQCRRIDSTGS